MCVVAIGDSANRMAEDLNRRLRKVLIVVRGTSLAEVLEHPGLVFTILHVCLGHDAGQIAELPKSSVRARSSPKEKRIVGARILRHDALDVGVDDAIHRPVKSLARLHPTVEEPSPR